MKTDRKPPLARSPMRLHGRRPLQPPNSNTITPLRTPSMMSKPQIRGSENNPVSCELKVLAKMVQDELDAINAKNTESRTCFATINGSNLFERGRFYDAYSQRRNERLRKKQSETGDDDDEPKTAYNLGVKLDSTMKKDYRKKADSVKKSAAMAAATYSSVDRSQHPRYSLRSTTKKPPIPAVPMNVDDKATARKAPSTRARRK